ncbi:MAG: hypothetical protein NTX25_12735 [Proteobacteria bacterium]|nr:hypothetical protein [Pseudomonadota bacterium]
MRRSLIFMTAIVLSSSALARSQSQEEPESKAHDYIIDAGPGLKYLDAIGSSSRFSLGYRLLPNTVLRANYGQEYLTVKYSSKEDKDTKITRSDYTSASGDGYGMGIQSFLTASLFINAEINHSTLKAKNTTRITESGQADIERSFDVGKKSITSLDLGLGTLWQWSYLHLGVAWGGVIIPIQKSETLTVDGQAFKYEGHEDFSKIGTHLGIYLTRIYFGMSF